MFHDLDRDNRRPSSPSATRRSTLSTLALPPDLPTVLDIEASGFGPGSYPIEIGWVRGDGRAGCLLVRPAADWTHWDEGAERLHGITRTTLLRHGHAAPDVARRLNDELAGEVVYCDGWGQDYSWLAVLFEAAAMTPAFRLEPAARLLPDAQLAQLDGLHRRAFAELGVQRHRASNDARALQQALAALGARGLVAAPVRA